MGSPATFMFSLGLHDGAPHFFDAQGKMLNIEGEFTGLPFDLAKQGRSPEWIRSGVVSSLESLANILEKRMEGVAKT